MAEQLHIILINHVVDGENLSAKISQEFQENTN